MIRLMLAVALIAALVHSSQAQEVVDYDCSSDLAGPFTPAGTLRVENETRFSFLDPATATPGPSYPMAIIDGERVDFDPAFAQQIAPGASLIEASYFADTFTFEAALITPQGVLVMVSCPYIY